MSARNHTCESSSLLIVQRRPWKYTIQRFSRALHRQRGCSLGRGSSSCKGGLLFVEPVERAAFAGVGVVGLGSVSRTAADVTGRIHFTAPKLGADHCGVRRRQVLCRYHEIGKHGDPRITRTLDRAESSHQSSKLPTSDPADALRRFRLAAPDTDSLSRCTSWSPTKTFHYCRGYGRSN
jgi:hypothetical protein